MFEDAIEALEQFSNALGFDPKRLPECEKIDKVRLERYDLPIPQALKLELYHFERLTEAFDGCFICQFALHEEDLKDGDEDAVVLTVKRGITGSDVKAFHEQIREAGSVEYLFQLDKGKLLEKEGISAPDINHSLYLFPAALTRLIKGETPDGEPCSVRESLKVLEETLWHMDLQDEEDIPPDAILPKAVILVPGYDILLNGDHLALFGGTHFEEWRNAVPTRRFPVWRVMRIHERRRESVSWDEGWLDHLTPPMLKIRDGIWADGDPLTVALQTHLFNLIVLFTANRIAGSKADWTATYSDSALGTRDVVLHSPAQKTISPQALARVNQLYEAFTWAYYSRWVRDRLSFVQSSIAQELLRSPREDACVLLLERAGGLNTSLNRHWDRFIQKQLKAYSEEEQKLEEAVVRTIDSFAEQVAAIFKSVSDAMLAAIAALLGSFVAAGFGSDKFNPFIFRAGMVVYSLYVLAFPLLYNMINQWLQYRVLKSGMEGRIERFKDKLGEDIVETIATLRIRQSDRNFRFWFWVTVGIYVVAILLGFLAAVFVPGLIA